MELEGYIACICEGGAEEAIMEILLKNGKLQFSYENLLEGKILRERKAKNFEKKYLNKGFAEQITIIRIIDSKNENFTLSKQYTKKIKVINCITSPEIEMLVIIKEKKYNHYKKSSSHMKPSDYCKNVLHLSDVKDPSFVKSYFSDCDELIEVILEYKRISKKQGDIKFIADLLAV